MRWLLWLPLLMICCCPARGQHFSMQHYGAEEGLPSNRIYELYRDRKGYLWFATDKGVARYNGVRFQVFTTAEGLSCNDVLSFCEDYQGRLWFLAYNGTLCFYKDGQIHNATTDTFLRKNYKTGHMENTMLQYDSSITFYLNGGSAFVSIRNNEKKVYPLESPYNNGNSNDIVKIAADRYKVMPDFSETGAIIDTSSHLINTVAICPLWATWGQGQRHYYDNHAVYMTRDGAPSFRFHANKGLPFTIRRIYRSMDDRWLIATDNGLYLSDSIHLFPGKDIYAITQDIEGNYWISEKNNGIFKISNWQNGVKHYAHQYNFRCVHAFANDSTLYFATGDNSVYRFQQGQIDRILAPEKYRPAPGPFSKEAHGMLTSSGDYYTFFHHEFFRIRNIQSAQRTISHFNTAFHATYSKSLFYRDSTLYAHGIHQLLSIRFLPGHKTSMKDLIAPGRRIYAADVDTAGNFWYSEADAMYKYTAGHTQRQPQFGDVAFKWFRFYGPYLLGITHEDRLLLCHHIEHQVHIDTIDNHDFVCDKFYLLNRDHVLLNTNGLYRVLHLYQPDHSPRYTLQTIDNPLLPMQAEYVCTNASTCFFLSRGDIYSIPIRDMLLPPSPPQLFFTTLQSGKHLLQLGSTPGTIDLPYARGGNIDIRFDVLSFRNSNVIYEYSLSRDAREHWQPTRDEHIRIPDPGYGDYRIKVRVRTPGSAFSKPILLQLHIQEPFWATWWFVACCCICLAVLGGLIVHYRVTFMLRKKEQLHRNEIKFLRSEYKALNALMNPHFIFNTLNSVQTLINRDDRQAATAYLKTFSDLIRQNMHNISDELISLQREINLVEHYIQLEKLRFKELLNYTIEISDAVDTEEIMIPPLLIQPLVENAIRHGLMPAQSPDNRLTIRIYEQGYDLYIEITDNGVGLSHQRRSNTAHSSFSLKNIRQRIGQLSMLHQISISMDMHALTNEAGQERGTRVVLIVKEPDL